ncbi:MAG: rane carboxypeptidase [Candidatus Midichloriaceae bacterium]|jgi:penicillin-binding protein 1A|nr:rane carboxypeptidase [Candidatus Midichloriaceae bacterium]
MALKNKKKSLKKTRKPKLRIKLKSIIFSLFSIILFFAISSFLLLSYLLKDLPDIEEMADRDVRPQITIYDSEGVVLAKYGDFRGERLTYSNIPIYMIQAVIAAEDRRFFEHMGIDLIGIIRAYFVNLKAGRVVQGGSTITQQLAKIIYLSPERTFKRKLQEIIIALELERKFSKEQIISLYLNRVYLGKGNYGIDAASKYYFGKSGTDLGIFESAIIAGLLKAPSRYSPSNNPALAIGRARQVLEQMYNEGYITEEQYKYGSPPTIIERGVGRGALKNPYFADYILSEIPDLVQNTNQDLNIYTTLNIKAQEALEEVIEKYATQAKNKYNADQMAGLVMEPNGAIKAMVGGVSYHKSQFNRAVTAKRQPGSAFKFFIYLAALENGLELNDQFVDEPISIKQGRGMPLWSPRNIDRKYRGEMTAEDAFARSINTIAVKISESVGIDKVVEITKRLGIMSNIPRFSSIALGTAEMSLLEMTQSFAHIANYGRKAQAFGVIKITDSNGGVLYEFPGVEPEQVIDPEVSEKMRDLLRSVILSGSGKRAAIPGVEVFGKTGTTQEHHDAWFIGFTDDIVTGIWIGNDNSSPTSNLGGAGLPALVFHDFNQNVGHIEKTEITNDSTPWQNQSIFDLILR